VKPKLVIETRKAPFLVFSTERFDEMLCYDILSMSKTILFNSESNQSAWLKGPCFKNMNLDEWFKKRRFKAKSYSDIDRLIKYKKEKEETIAVVIPAFNEEERIGKVVREIKKKLMDEKPLVDELVVVDSGSKDNTKKEAEEAGADFYFAADILKRYNGERGKGENMWKSLYVTESSIIVYMDADIENIHPRFVYGLVGPLLTKDYLKLVKSFFDRPTSCNGEGEDVLGGGRVTELLVRPLLNMYFPSLVGFVQPLSGQVAGRRSLFEQLNYFTGYGVDIGLLIDTYKKYDLESIAQSDIGSLRHRCHDLHHLSQMAFGVLQVFAERAHVLGKVIMSEDVRRRYHVVNRKEEKNTANYELKKKYVTERERDPMITIKNYRKKFHKNGFE